MRAVRENMYTGGKTVDDKDKALGHSYFLNQIFRRSQSGALKCATGEEEAHLCVVAQKPIGNSNVSSE